MSDSKKYPTTFQQAVCWTAFTGLCIFFIVAMVSSIMYVFSLAFIFLEPVLLPIIIAAVMAYLLMPLVRFVQNKLKVKSRKGSVCIILALTFIGLSALGCATAIPIYDQTKELLSNRQEYVRKAQISVHSFIDQNVMAQKAIDFLYKKACTDVVNDPDLTYEEKEYVREAASKSHQEKAYAIMVRYSHAFTDVTWSVASASTRAIYGGVGYIIGFAMIPVFLFYFLLKEEDISQSWDRILPLTRSHFRAEVVYTLKKINGNIIAFVRGQMLTSLIDAVILAVVLSCMKLPGSLIIAAVAALLGIIPYVGMISTCIPALIIALLNPQYGLEPLSYAAIIAVIFIIVSQIDGWIIQPRIVGNTVGMHDLTVMFAILFWSTALGGIVGALLAVPLTAAIKVIFKRYIWRSFRRKNRRKKLIPKPEEAPA